VLRRLAGEVPTVEGLGLPPILSQMAEERNGLLLATGATGGGMGRATRTASRARRSLSRPGSSR
jgi:Tfp pilus assembly pilus retraction ATPase PilT